MNAARFTPEQTNNQEPLTRAEYERRRLALKARMAEDDPWHLGSAAVFAKWDEEEAEENFLKQQAARFQMEAAQELGGMTAAYLRKRGIDRAARGPGMDNTMTGWVPRSWQGRS